MPSRGGNSDVCHPSGRYVPAMKPEPASTSCPYIVVDSMIHWLDLLGVGICVHIKLNRWKESGSVRVHPRPHPIQCFSKESWVNIFTTRREEFVVTKSFFYLLNSLVCCLVVGRFQREKLKKLPQCFYKKRHFSTPIDWTSFPYHRRPTWWRIDAITWPIRWTTLLPIVYRRHFNLLSGKNDGRKLRLWDMYEKT